MGEVVATLLGSAAPSQKSGTLLTPFPSMSNQVHRKLMEKRNADFVAASDVFFVRFSLPAEYEPLGVPLVHVCKLEGLGALVCWFLSSGSVRVLSVQHKRGPFPVAFFEIPA